jgi:hypothetical protein
MGRVCGTHENEERICTIYWWGKLKERLYLENTGVALGVSYGGKFSSHVFKILGLGLGRGYVYAIAPSDALISLPQHDGRKEIKHYCNDNGETSEFVV